jgi:hypothetical protein
MATNKKKYLLLAIILFGFASFLPAQTAGYFFEEEGDEVKIFQRFVWSGGEYALQYEVVFERETDGEYKTYLREFTKSQFIEVSLPSGSYRFCVIPYDILEKPAAGSEWVYIDVFSISRQEEYEEPETELEPETETEFILLEPVSEEIPVDEPEQEQAQSDLLKPLLFSVGADIGLQLRIYGNAFGYYNFPVNAGIHASVVFKTLLDIYIGPEISSNINMSGMNEKWDMYLFTIGVNLLAIKWLPNEKYAVGLRMGAHYPYLNFRGNIKADSQDDPEDNFQYSSLNNLVYEDGFSVGKFIPNIGASFYWFIKKNLLFEAGFNYMHIFNDVPSGYFRPMIGINWQF